MDKPINVFNSSIRKQEVENDKIHTIIDIAITNLIEELVKNKVNLNDFSLYWSYKNEKSNMQGGFGEMPQ